LACLFFSNIPSTQLDFNFCLLLLNHFDIFCFDIFLKVYIFKGTSPGLRDISAKLVFLLLLSVLCYFRLQFSSGWLLMANTIICLFLQSSLIVSFHMKMSICIHTPNIEQQVELNLNANKIYLIRKLIKAN